MLLQKMHSSTILFTLVQNFRNETGFKNTIKIYPCFSISVYK